MRSLSDEVRAAQVIGRIHYLQAADATWTAAVGRGRSEEVDGLEIVTNELRTTVAALREDVPFIVRLASELDEDGIEQKLSHPKMPKELIDAFRHLAEHHGGYAKLVEDHLGRLDGALASKRDALDTEYDRLRSGGPRPISGGSDAEACAWGIGLAVLGGAPAVSAAGVLLAILSC